jgi:wyosine [tRNA(Phe)-imidazoG37] synthetase (radical SAM superfamily)
MKNDFKYIYGPVPSWRLGSSLGIDLLSQEQKICNFECIYCQLGKAADYTVERKIYVDTRDVLGELNHLPKVKIDYITFSGRGEPSLATNLGEAIKQVKRVRREPIAILTNSSLMSEEAVRGELSKADFVAAKFDAYSQKSLKAINNPDAGIIFSSILEGIKEFRDNYSGRMALQMMFTHDNKNNIHDLADLANYIKPNEVQVNTPLRPCGVRPLKREEIFRIKKELSYACKGIEIMSVYDERPVSDIKSISNEDTLKRRGKV